ncbi:MAG TPA: TetR/AcrR family transcriptional regulator [Nitrospirae bacterium]|nr:TetR/AcrR family transcriptional regulator [Nitrospirota bacterium]
MKKRLKKINTKERLLEATFELISEKGYLGTTTREIASRAGVTEITLFRHFGSKERLFEEVLKKYTFLPRLKEIIPRVKDSPPEEALSEMALRFIETLKERKGMVKIMLSEMNVYPDKIRKVYEKFIEELVKTLSGYFDTLRDRGTIRDIDTHLASRAFLGMVFCYFQAEEITKSRRITRKEAERVVREFVDIFLKGIGG